LFKKNKLEKLTTQCKDLKEKVTMLEQTVDDSDRPKLEAVKQTIASKEKEIEELTQQKKELEEKEQNEMKKRESKTTDSIKKKGPFHNHHHSLMLLFVPSYL
jgi:outer membrane murein-binding lipoprotein Lpp